MDLDNLQAVNDHTQELMNIRLALLTKQDGQVFLTAIEVDNPIHSLNFVYQPTDDWEGIQGEFHISKESVGGNIDFRDRIPGHGEVVFLQNGDRLMVL